MLMMDPTREYPVIPYRDKPDISGEAAVTAPSPYRPGTPLLPISLFTVVTSVHLGQPAHPRHLTHGGVYAT